VEVSCRLVMIVEICKGAKFFLCRQKIGRNDGDADHSKREHQPLLKRYDQQLMLEQAVEAALRI
jgi:hypothetical protein